MKQLEKIYNLLEFNKILENIAKFASTSSAKELLLQTKPYENITKLNNELDLVEQTVIVETTGKCHVSFSFEDIRLILQKAKLSSLLSISDIIKIAKMIKATSITKNNLVILCDDSTPDLKNLVSSISNQKKLLNEIERCIISETEINDNASVNLAKIRKEIRNKSDQIKKQINKFSTSPIYATCLQDNIVTIRNDRYVLPVKAEYRSFIPGLIHDRSASGQTLYIEPMSIVELNNDLKSLQLDEESEIQKILYALTLEISINADQIGCDYDKMIKLDMLFAKVYYAKHHKAIRPIINNKGIIDISKGRHPLIDLNKVIPTTISIGKTFNILIITGPNTGGKTVTLKLVGLFVLMAMAGIYVHAESANISIFSSVYCDIGDEQSIEQNLSTFSSHISNIKYIVDNVDEKSLVLLDELGAGTDPKEGSALALSIVDYLEKVKVKALITTHYNELKEYALVKSNFQNASMEFDHNTYEPTFNLLVGSPGFSNALFIASKLGLKQEIIDNATTKMNKIDIETEDLLKSIEKMQTDLNSKQQKLDLILNTNVEKQKEIEKELENIKRIKENLQNKAENFKAKYIKNKLVEIDKIVDDIKQLAETPTTKNLFKARDLKSKLKKINDNQIDSNLDAETPQLNNSLESFNINDSVFVKSLNQEGIIIEILKKNKFQIKLGNFAGIFDVSDLIPLANKKTDFDKNIKVGSIFSHNLSDRAIPMELNLIGLTGLEAEMILTQYISDAYASKYQQVKIVHGYGTGKLKAVVEKALSNSSIVKSYREGGFGEGGSGVTIVNFY